MNPSEKLKLAGLAATELDAMGFVAVGKMRDGVVTLELYRGHTAMRYELPDVDLTPRALADACVAEYRVRVEDADGDSDDN